MCVTSMWLTTISAKSKLTNNDENAGSDFVWIRKNIQKNEIEFQGIVLAFYVYKIGRDNR